MGCHLGWHFTVGCPLRGGRGKCKIIGTSVPPKTIKKKKLIKNIYRNLAKAKFKGNVGHS
jgi:hypothetical protein